MDAPTHDEVVGLWSATSRGVGGEPAIIVMPTPRGDILCAGFYPTENIPLTESVTMIVESLHHTIASPCRWIAAALPGYTQSMPVDADAPAHGDLEAAYVAGDESVREALSVMVLALEPDAPVMMRTYIQPLLEPEDDAGPAADDGPMAYSLRIALLLANMDRIG